MRIMQLYITDRCNNDAIEDCVYYKEKNLKKCDYVVSQLLWTL